MGKKNSENIENIEPVVETTEEPVVETTENRTVGVVDNCTRLNVRQSPSKQSNVLTIVSKGTGLGINLDESTEDFYCVRVLIDNELVEGYCLKDFIEIK